MKQPWFIPIRTKILAALILLTVGVLVAFLLSSRALFQKDKMAYLFDLNQETAVSKATMVNSTIQQWFQAVSALSLYVDGKNRTLGSAGEILFNQFKDLDVVTVDEVLGQEITPVLVRHKPGLEREPDRVRMWAQSLIRRGENFPRIEISNEPSEVRIALRRSVVGDQNKSILMGFRFSMSKLSSLFQSASDTRTLLLDDGLNVVSTSEPSIERLWTEIRDQSKLSGLHQVSQLAPTSQGSYLISFARLDDYGFYVLTMTPEGVVTRVLRDLLHRTLYVAAMALFGVVFISIIFAKSLTANLELLLEAVGRVAKGDFDLQLKVAGRDETGLLAKSFETMSGEIRRLLVETAEKSRMEGELKTAQAVQATLFPEGDLRWNGFEVTGLYRSASECGGDWWYYKTCDRFIYLVVADATGHGAPAALITSAARSALSLLANEDPPSIESVAKSLNRAVYETSKGQLMMTALFLRIDTSSGRVEIVNCSHEFPFLIVSEGSKPDCLVTESSSRLGQAIEVSTKVDVVEIVEGQTLVLFTDGLMDVVSPEGKAFGERRVLKELSRAKGTTTQVLEGLVASIDDFSKGTEYVDDVTIVLIRRTGLRLESAAAP